MKKLATLLPLLILLLSATFVNAQSTSTENIDQMREERAVYVFNLTHKYDLDKKEAMGEQAVTAEQADLATKRREIQVVNDESFPKMIEMNNQQQASWEYAQAKKAWIAANPEKYQAMLEGGNSAN